ncbi:hypothetical protein [Limosilactobacillus antri]|uniref:hypothetical protein n=1 Tax=Limosilactobacillus antri TaxID=227943 RepID=UPI001F587914|nr:hypothetical protein [Limosilactobacillus antri]
MLRKYISVLAVLIIGIAAFACPQDVHAAKYDNLYGRVYKCTSYTLNETGVAYYLFFDDEGYCVKVDDPNSYDSSDPDEKNDLRKLKSKINKLTKNKKSSNNVFYKDSEKFSLDGGDKIISNDPNNFVYDHEYGDNSRYLTTNGSRVTTRYVLTPADPSMQYKFKW